MMKTMRPILKLNSLLINTPIKCNSFNGQIRFLYSDESIGMNRYLRHREKLLNVFGDMTESFRSQVAKKVEQESEIMFTEDMKTMLHIVRNTPEDLSLAMKMMRKINNQDKLSHTEFSFGPVVMRAYHYLNAPDDAIAAYMDPLLKNFFKELSSCQILLNLLFKNGRYEDMMKVYDIYRKDPTRNIKHPRECTVLIMAACYKQNTKESLNYGLEIYQEITANRHSISRRSITLLAGLALKLGEPSLALNIVSKVDISTYITVRCIKLAAFADLDRTEYIITLFRKSLYKDTQVNKKERFFRDVIKKVEACIERTGAEEDSEICQLLKALKQNDYIEDKDLEEQLLETLEVPDKHQLRKEFQNRGHQTPYNARTQKEKTNSYQLPTFNM